MIQQTSLNAYQDLVRSEDIGLKQKVVLLCLMNDGPANNRVISVRCRMPINTVTPRVKELRDIGLVRARESSVDSVTRRSAIVWEAVY